MFWSKTDREARRQKVLDELIEIEPVDRPSRLQEAVTAGDVRASEVDQALRLVDRLDALRVMSIPHVDGGFRGAAHGTDTETVVGRAEAPVVAADVESAPAEAEVRADAVSADRIVRSRERRLVARKGSKAKAGVAAKALGRAQKSTAVPIVREPTAVPIEPEMLPTIDPLILAAPMPIDALESAARLMARDFGGGKAQRPVASPRPRTRVPGDDVAAAAAEPSVAGGSRRQPEPAKPSIDWLRP